MSIIKKIKRALQVYFPKKYLACVGDSVVFEPISYISWPACVSIESDVRVRKGTNILISEHDTLLIKKYTVVGMNCMIVTNKHRSTVGIPHILLGASGINDQHYNMVIGEDVWIGANVTITGGSNIGRGSILGACCNVTKDVPPYALVVGSPAKIVGVKFSIDQIIEHEKILYPENERFSREYLEDLFAKNYSDKRIFGTSTTFSEENFDRLQKCVVARGFTDSNYLERLRSLKDNLESKY